MYKKIIAKLTVIILTTLLLTTPTTEAKAQAPTETKETIIKNQNTPLKRIEEIEKEINQIRNTEEGIAKQHDITETTVIQHEIVLADTINYYESLYFLRQHGSVSHITLPDENRIAELAATTPPYNFLMFLDYMESLYVIKAEIKREEEKLEESNKNLSEATLEMGKIEREYRILSSKKENGEGEILALHWEEKEIEAKLELAMTKRTFYKLNKSYLETNIPELKTRLSLLEKTLEKIRNNFEVSKSDFTYLDALVYQKITDINKRKLELSKKYKTLAESKRLNENPTEFEKYFVSTEEAQITYEIRFLLDLKVYLQTVRLALYTMDDILDKRFGSSTKKELFELTNEYKKKQKEAMVFCNTTIQVIRETEQELNKRFYTKMDTLTSEEKQQLQEETITLSERKIRYLHYLSELGSIKEIFTLMELEVQRMQGSMTTDEKVETFWYERVLSIADKELWHISDYPITLVRLLKGLTAFLLCILISKYIGKGFEHKAQTRNRLSRHEIILIRKVISSIGFVLAIITALWSLRIPFTAFAFLGGAMAIALGLGTQKIMGDFFSGVLLLLQGKLRVGDEVIIGDMRGIVTELTIQNTVLRCQQSKELVIPNSKVHNSPIINLTLSDTQLMIRLDVGVAYQSDIKKVTQIIQNVMENHPAILKNPAPKVVMDEFEESSIKFTAVFFINLKKDTEGDIKSQIRYKIIEEFEKEKINIPYPQRDIHIKENK
ncbi:MAG: mechanosensitive ion channel [Synergistaceae bacterium]